MRVIDRELARRRVQTKKTVNSIFVVGTILSSHSSDPLRDVDSFSVFDGCSILASHV